MTVEAARTAAAAFISCRLDYCNTLLCRLPDTLLCAECHCTTDHWHATLVLRELHWLPIRERVKFKVACLVRQSLSGGRLSTWPTTAVSCPTALGALCGQLTFRRVVPRTLSSYGDRTFAAAGPRLWNTLPVQLRNPDITYRLFRRQLKEHPFREA